MPANVGEMFYYGDVPWHLRHLSNLIWCYHGLKGNEMATISIWFHLGEIGLPMKNPVPTIYRGYGETVHNFTFDR